MESLPEPRGTLAWIVVPRLGCESIDRVPFTSLSLSSMLMRPVLSEDRRAAAPLETGDLWSTGDQKQHAWTETPSPLYLRRSGHAKGRRLDGSLERAVALPQSCCPAQIALDLPNRDSRRACGRVPFGFSSRYLASRSRCRRRVQRFASATCRP